MPFPNNNRGLPIPEGGGFGGRPGPGPLPIPNPLPDPIPDPNPNPQPTPELTFGFNPELLERLGLVGPNAQNRLQQIFANLFGNQQGKRFGSFLGATNFDAADPNFEGTQGVTLGLVDLENLFESGFFKPGSTREQFIQSILNFQEETPDEDPTGGGGGGGGFTPIGGRGFEGGGGFGDFLQQLIGGQDPSQVAGPPELSDFMKQLQGAISQALEGPFGLPEDVLERERNAIVTRLAQVARQQGEEAEGRFNVLGQGRGGGQFANVFGNINQAQSSAAGTALRELGLQDALFANQGRQQALTSGLGLADILGRRELGFGGLGTERELGLGRLALGQGELGLRGALGFGDLDLRRQLGLGALDIEQQGVDLSRLGLLGDFAMQEFLRNLFLLFGLPGGGF